MKVVLAGAFGNLGRNLLRALVRDGMDVVAADRVEDTVSDMKR